MKIIRLMLGLIAIAALAPAVEAQTLADVRDRGYLLCGVHPNLPGFAIETDDGEWRGFDTDYCRAIAAAIFDDPDAIQFVALRETERFTALQVGLVDVLFHGIAWTMERDVPLGFDFAAITYFDGQGFIVPKDSAIESPSQLDGASICVPMSAAAEANLADYFGAAGASYEPIIIDDFASALAAYDAGECDAFTANVSRLHAVRLGLERPTAHRILRETISKEPLGPLVLRHDGQWFDVVKWVCFALVNSEELGVTQINVETLLLTSENHAVLRLLGAERSYGEMLGLADDWAFNIIRRLGNYGEIYERNLGQGSRLGIPRGPNALAADGGLQFVPPIR